MSLPYYKKFPRDFLDGTIGLSLETKGAYAIILDLIYMRDGRLQDDPRYISGQLGCSVRKWTAIQKELVEKGKLKVENGIISNFRADYLVEETRKYRDKQSEIASLPRKNNDLRQPEPSQSDTDTDITPYPLNFAPLARLLELACQGSWKDLVTELHERQPKTNGKRKTTTPDVRDALAAAMKRGAKPDDLRRAFQAYYALPDCKRADGQYSMGAKVLLAKDRWREYLPSPKLEIVVSPELVAHRQRHFDKTGEWRSEWGERPELNRLTG